MNVLITGANGYIGARLAVSLLKKGISVRLGTRQFMGPRPEFEGAQAVTLDLENPSQKSLEEACKGIDTIIHLAAFNDQQCKENPERALKVNVEGTRLLVDAAIKSHVRQFIYFSTAHVYGSPLQGEYTEDSIVNPVSHYARTHKQAEDLVLTSSLSHKTVFRLSNGIGAPLFPETNCWMLLVNDLCKQAVQSGKMVLKSHGLQLRNFISLSQVEDVVSQSLAQGNGSSSQLMNLIGITKSVLETAKEIQSLASEILKRPIDLIAPSASPEELSQVKSSNLNLKTRYAFYSPEAAKLEYKNALVETLNFCKDHP